MSQYQQDVIELQTRLSYQEEELNALNKIVAQHDRDMALLQKRYERLQARFERAMGNIEADTPVDEKPPHY